MEILGKRHPLQSQELAGEQQPGGQLARSSPAFVGERRERSARETPGLKLSKTTGLSQCSLQLRERFPSLSRQRLDLRDPLEAGLPSVEGSTPSSSCQLLEGARMDKSNWGDTATSKAGECSNRLIETMQSSQRNGFSIKTKQRQRLSCARPGCSQRSSSE